MLQKSNAFEVQIYLSVKWKTRQQDVLLTLLEPHTILALATNNTRSKSRDSLESAGKMLLKHQ